MNKTSLVEGICLVINYLQNVPIIRTFPVVNHCFLWYTIGMKNGKVKVGDKIVENGKVFRVFKIKKKKINGEEERIAFFRRYYKKGADTSVVGSIPVKNIKDANIRMPVDKDEIKKAKKKLSNGKEEDDLNLKALKKKFNENKIIETAEIAKHLWEERKRREKLPPTKKKLLKQSLRSLSEEFAFVLDKKLDKARKTVKRNLKS